jgi:hypothetical protein
VDARWTPRGMEVWHGGVAMFRKCVGGGKLGGQYCVGGMVLGGKCVGGRILGGKLGGKWVEQSPRDVAANMEGWALSWSCCVLPGWEGGSEATPTELRGVPSLLSPERCW